MYISLSDVSRTATSFTSLGLLSHILQAVEVYVFLWYCGWCSELGDATLQQRDCKLSRNTSANCNGTGH
jgi:hypothetical protein